jgi:hypothetical protein
MIMLTMLTLSHRDLSKLRRAVQFLRDARRAAGEFATPGRSPLGDIHNMICDVHDKFDLGAFDLFPEENPERESHRFEVKLEGTTVGRVEFRYLARRCEMAGDVKFPDEAIFAIAQLRVGEATSVSDACRRYRIKRIK